MRRKVLVFRSSGTDSGRCSTPRRGCEYNPPVPAISGEKRIAAKAGKPCRVYSGGIPGKRWWSGRATIAGVDRGCLMRIDVRIASLFDRFFGNAATHIAAFFYALDLLRRKETMICIPNQPSDKPQSGSHCPICPGKLQVVNTKVIARTRVRYLGCRSCGHRPEQNIVCVPLGTSVSRQ